MNQTVCLTINNLSVTVRTMAHSGPVVNGISLIVPQGKVVGLVGESGSGKSMTAMAVMRLLNSKQFSCQGEICFEGQDLMALPEKEMRGIRGRRIGMIFQNPMTALNPVLTIGRQLQEMFITHCADSAARAKEKSLEMLERVRMPQPLKVYRQYPYELSGGMSQRVMIAMALALCPALVIADEPTTALDVTLQAQILNELQHLQKHYGTAILLISHDMGVVAEIADEVAVMRQGAIVEYTNCTGLFDRPRHEYTKKLLAANRLEEESLAEESHYGIPAP